MGITLESIKSKMIGSKFGKLTILSYVGKSEKGDNLWKARCECGELVVGRTSNVDKPHSACTKCKIASGPKAQERRIYLLGKKFGRLTVMEFAGMTDYNAGTWKCSCECGNEIITRSAHLSTGVTRSCGCYAKERVSEKNTTHGLHNHPLYSVWYAMKDRCYNDKNKFYYRYGARGIRVCDYWLENFIVFYNWAISKGYQKGLTLERTDNNGDYEPGNCKWATRKEQSQNQSTTRITPEQAAAIYNDSRTNITIAQEYQVAESTISRIKAKSTWRNVTNPPISTAI